MPRQRRHHLRHRMTCPAFLVVLLAGANVARAVDEDRYSVESDAPVRLQDAFPLEAGEGYLKLTSRYERSGGTDVTLVQPELAFGFAPNFDVHVLVPTLIGEGDRGGSGDVTLISQVLLLEQRPGDAWPSLAVEAAATIPSGKGSAGLDTAIQLIATQTLSWSPAYDAVHVNLIWAHNAQREPDAERSEGYAIAAGYTRRIADATAIVVAGRWERSTDKGGDGTIAELGVIRSFGEHVDLSAGVGVGLGDDAPDVAATLSLVLSF